MRSGTSGTWWRDSISAKAARSRADPASGRIVRASPHPARGASTTAYTSRTSAPVIVSAPAVEEHHEERAAKERKRPPAARIETGGRQARDRRGRFHHQPPKSFGSDRPSRRRGR